MTVKSKKYKVSQEIVTREIEGEIIIVSLDSDIGSMDDNLYTLNATGKEIWKYLDGQHSIQDITTKLLAEYDAPENQIADQIHKLIAELLKKGIIVEIDDRCLNLKS